MYDVQGMPTSVPVRSSWPCASVRTEQLFLKTQKHVAGEWRGSSAQALGIPRGGKYSAAQTQYWERTCDVPGAFLGQAAVNSLQRSIGWGEAKPQGQQWGHSC